MSKNRIKAKLPPILNRSQAEAMVGAMAASTNAILKVTAEMDARILAVKKEYESGLAVMQAANAARMESLKIWALANPAEFPKDRKSIDFLSGTLGFRTGTPKVELLNRKWNWKKVLTAIQERAFSFVRSTAEVDKEAIIEFAAAEKDKASLQAKVLDPIGVKVTQDETFYVEPNLTDTAPIKKAA